MKRYSIVHVPVLSFFSKALYRDVCHQWKGVGFAYLLLLLIVCWIAPIVKVHTGLSNFVDNEAPRIVSQIPTISIVDGKASINEPQPYRITEPDTGKTLAVIDTTGAARTLADANAFALITETEAIFKKSEIETQTFSFRDIDEFTLDQDMVTGWLAAAKKVVPPVLYVLAVLGAFVFRILQALIYACIGMMFASWCKARFTYASLLRLSIVAVTPGIIVETVLDVAQVNLPYAILWYFLAAMGFLYFGVKAASQDQDTPGASTSPYVANVPDVPYVSNVSDVPHEPHQM